MHMEEFRKGMQASRMRVRVRVSVRVSLRNNYPKLDCVWNGMKISGGWQGRSPVSKAKKDIISIEQAAGKQCSLWLNTSSSGV